MEVKNDNDIENNNIETEEDYKEENQENSRIDNKEDKKEYKEENKEDNKEKNKIENNDVNKDENNANNNLNLSNSFQRINSENEIDKITPGLNESQNNVNNLNINDNKNEVKNEEEEEEENKNEENENLNGNTILGDIFRSVVKIKSKQPKEILSVSLYKRNLDNESKDFASIIKAKINEIKQNTLNLFDKAMNEFDKRYNEYFNIINKYINENELKIGKLLEGQMDQIENENLLDFSDKYIFDKFENIFEIHQNIFDSIEDHINLLKLFLKQTNLIQKKNPLECYLNNNSCEILNSWFLYKIDYQKLDLSNIIINKYLSDLCSQYLCKKKKNNFSNITINKDNNEFFSLQSSFIKENLRELKKIRFIKLQSDEINSLFTYPFKVKLNSLTFINSDLSSSDLNNLNPSSLIKLELKKDNLPLINLKSFFGNFLGKALFLEKLYLQKCSIDNQSLSEVFEFISDAPKILESLQFLSFKGNDITKVDLTNNIIKKHCFFKSLKYIDCSKNNIYDFSQENFQSLPGLKVLDLTDNNICNHLFFDNIRKLPDIIVLLSNNLFLNNNKENAEDYRKYLNNKLMQFNHKIKKLNVSFLYNKNILEQLSNLKLSPMVKISLIKLNLSYCGLDDITTCKFLQNNFGILNLKELNLSNNFITVEILNLLIQNEISFENLYSLDLSMNNIDSVNLDNYKQIDLFTEINSKLKKLKFRGTKFSHELLKIKADENLKKGFEEITQKLCNKGVKFVVENEFEQLANKMKNSFELKDIEEDSF